MKKIFTLIGLGILSTLAFTIFTVDNLNDSANLLQAVNIAEAEGFVTPDATRPPAGALPTQTGLQEEGTVIELVADIINWLLGFIGVVVLGLFIYAGVQYATAGGDEGKTQSAVRMMTNAVIGLLILFIAYAASNAILGFVFQSANQTANMLVNLL
jgi:hypothetical protein